MAPEEPARTLYAPPDKKFNSIGDLWAALVEMSNLGHPVAKELIVGWQSLKNQSQIIVNQLCVKDPELIRYEPDCPLAWEKQPFMIRVKLIQHVEQLSIPLQKCDNSWVAEQIVAHKIKNKRENLMKRIPDSVVLPKSRSATPAGGRPRPSGSSFNSTLSTIVATDEDCGDLDDASSSNNAEPHDVADDTSFQTTATRCAEIKSICNTPALRRGRGAARGGRGRGAKQQSAAKTQALPNDVAEVTERKPSWKIRENQEVEEAISAKRKAKEELKEGRARIAKRSRANLVELFKKWTEEAGEMYEEVEREILWLGGVKFVGEYRGGRQIWTQAEPDEVDDEEEVIED